jgi:hypothetical protein
MRTSQHARPDGPIPDYSLTARLGYAAGWLEEPKVLATLPLFPYRDKFGLSKEATASYFLHGHYVHRSSGSENELGLVFACISRVSGFLPREKATVLPRLKKPEARVFSTILG